MIIVAGTFDVAPQDRAAFLAGVQAPIARSRAEPGCVEYSFSADSTEPGRVRLFEIWESDETLGAHLAALRAAGNPGHGVAILGQSLTRYEVARSFPFGS
ncbi:MAG TPA: putative quinol monooxygenase [Acidimicrobiales bacterium]|nr:putative quinol monooxygenase [Acidimicrobiales bacterium]